TRPPASRRPRPRSRRAPLPPRSARFDPTWRLDNPVQDICSRSAGRVARPASRGQDQAWTTQNPKHGGPWRGSGARPRRWSASWPGWRVRYVTPRPRTSRRTATTRSPRPSASSSTSPRRKGTGCGRRSCTPGGWSRGACGGAECAADRRSGHRGGSADSEPVRVPELHRPAAGDGHELAVVQDPGRLVQPVLRVDDEQVASRRHDPADAPEEAHQLALVVVLELNGRADPGGGIPLALELVDVGGVVALRQRHVVVVEVAGDADARRRPERDAGVEADALAVPETAPVEPAAQRHHPPAGGAARHVVVPVRILSGEDVHAVHDLVAVVQELVVAGGLNVEVVAALELHAEQGELELPLLDDAGAELGQVPELGGEVQAADPGDVRPRRIPDAGL